MAYRVKWREGGARQGRVRSRTFASKAEAYAYLVRVEQAGQHEPAAGPAGGGTGGSERSATAMAGGAAATFAEVAAGLIDRKVDLTPGTRRRYRAMVERLVRFELDGHRPFAGPLADLSEQDVLAWLRRRERSLKTKANYHGLLAAVCRYAVEQGILATSPCQHTAPRRRALLAASPEHEVLTEAEFALFCSHLPQDARDLVTVAVSTGLRFGELAALLVEDIDLTARTLRVNKAWKEVGIDGETDVPAHLARKLTDKHTMRGHYLGVPKSPMSRRTVAYGAETAAILARCIAGKAPDDFVFSTTPRSPGSSALRWGGGRPWHPTDFYDTRWAPARAAARKDGLTKHVRFHDLRHTYAAWALAAGADPLFIQRQLGHEVITTTMGVYGHLIPSANRPVTDAIDAALRGRPIDRWRQAT